MSDLGLSLDGSQRIKSIDLLEKNGLFWVGWNFWKKLSQIGSGSDRIQLIFFHILNLFRLNYKSFDISRI
jgi:hypothetical protein